MLDKISIKHAASVEKKTSCGFLCSHCVCKSLRAHDLLTVSCFQLAKWWKVIGLHTLAATLPPSLLYVIFLPPSCSDRVSPACTSLFQLRGSRRGAASCAPCSREGQGQWFIPISIMERDFGSGKKQTLCIPWDISEVTDEGEEEQFCPWVIMLNLVAAFYVGSGFTAQASCGVENCPRITWGQTEVRVSLSMPGCACSSRPPAPSEGDLGRGQPPCRHTWCMCSVAGDYEVSRSNWKRKKNQARCSPERADREDNSRLTRTLVHI